MKHKPPRSTLMQLRLPVDLRRQLIVEAAKRDVGRSELVEIAIRRLLKAPKQPEAA